MNDKVGHLSFPPSEQAFEERPFSDATAQLFDEEAKVVIGEAYERTKELLMTHKQQLVDLAELLLDKETINQDDIIATIGDRPFESSKEYAELIRSSWKESAASAENVDLEDGDAAEEDEDEEASGSMQQPAFSAKAVSDKEF